MMTRQSPELLAAFHDTVRRRIEADLEQERAEAAAIRAEVMPDIRGAIEDARRRALCGRAWLFGSFAWGQPTDRSDIDVLAEDCTDGIPVAAVLTEHTGRLAHVVPIEDAPPSLRERVLSSGVRL